MTTAIVETISQKRPFGEEEHERVLKARRVASVPNLQNQLLLHKIANPFQLHRDRSVPDTKPGEILIEVQAIGLNPIDWKSAQQGWGIPEWPCVSGKELAGKILSINGPNRRGLAVGDRVLSVVTEYRDFRKSAFQHFAVGNAFNAVKIPPHVDLAHTTAVGVAFIAAALTLGVCLGMSFKDGSGERNLLRTAKSQNPAALPKDVAGEVLDAISPFHTPYEGDWVLVYGASAITGQVIIQLCKLNKLRVIAIANLARHEARLKAVGADIVLDREDLDQAKRRIRELVPGPIRFAVDTVGKETAKWCENILASRSALPTAEVREYERSERQSSSPRPHLMAHLVGLNGVPKDPAPSVRGHKVPIKLFHEVPALGTEMSTWLSAMLDRGELQLPDAELLRGGLASINTGLQRLQSGELSGRRLVVELEELDRLPNSKLAVWPPESGGFCWC